MHAKQRAARSNAKEDKQRPCNKKRLKKSVEVVIVSSEAPGEVGRGPDPKEALDEAELREEKKLQSFKEDAS